MPGLERGEATVVASWTRRALAVAERGGASSSADRALERAGLTREALDGRTDRIPLRQHVLLLDALSAALEDPGFGLEVGAAADPSDFGLLGLLGESSATLGEALEVVERYDALANEGSAMRLESEGEALVIREAHARDGAPFPTVAAEATLAYYAVNIRRLTGVERPFREVRFAHLRHTGWTPAREAIFAAPLRFGGGAHGLVLDALQLDAPLLSARPGVVDQLAPLVDRLARERPSPDDVVARARARLRATLRAQAAAEPLDAIARRLGVSGRTLQRALSERGYRYRELVDAARREHVEVLLRQPELSLDAVAEAAGLADTRALRRACQRWFGASPAQLRHR